MFSASCTVSWSLLVCTDLSVGPLLRRVADVGGVGQHVGPVNVVDRFGFGKSSKVLVVQKFITKLCLNYKVSKNER